MVDDPSPLRSIPADDTKLFLRERTTVVGEGEEGKGRQGRIRTKHTPHTPGMLNKRMHTYGLHNTWVTG
jgi:hypothetical protein